MFKIKYLVSPYLLKIQIETLKLTLVVLGIKINYVVSSF